MRPWHPSQDGAFLQSESSLRESFSLSVLTMIPNHEEKPKEKGSTPEESRVETGRNKEKAGVASKG
jgi:hypothetical protein